MHARNKNGTGAKPGVGSPKGGNSAKGPFTLFWLFGKPKEIKSQDFGFLDEALQEFNRCGNIAKAIVDGEFQLLNSRNANKKNKGDLKKIKDEINRLKQQRRLMMPEPQT